MAYGYITWENGKTKFRTFTTLNACRKSAKNESFKSTDEYQILKCKMPHSKTDLERTDVLLGFVYCDPYDPKMKRYQPKNSKVSYPIKSDGSLHYKGKYEVVF